MTTTSPNTATDPIHPPTPFSDWLTDHAQGDVDVELTLALAEVVQAVSGIGKKGAIKLTVTVEPAGSGGRTVKTSCLVEAKAPTADPEESIFFVDAKGGLHRDDPFQARLPLKRVPPQAQLPDTTPET
jgi:hypothetical protein